MVDGWWLMVDGWLWMVGWWDGGLENLTSAPKGCLQQNLTFLNSSLECSPGGSWFCPNRFTQNMVKTIKQTNHQTLKIKNFAYLVPLG
jgi:hypothetical protein